ALLDEPARGVAGRVGEHRARVLATGLVLAAPADDLVDAGRAGFGIVGPARERGTDHDVAGPEGRTPVAEAQLARRPLGDGAARVEVGDAGRGDHRRGVVAVATRVHAHRTADAARDTDEELEPADAGRGGPARENRERHCPARVDTR